MTANIEKLALALESKYVIKHQIATGGMGSIYLGEHRILNKRVAIKIVNTDLSEDEEFRKRFFREAKLAANLVHPNIIDIYDYGRFDDIDYIIMQYIEGRDLKTILSQEGRLPLAKCLKYMTATAEAIAFAHNHGVIHRDLKPSNFIIDRDDHIFLTDFGISKDLRDIDLTTIDSVLGSPRYMSPEQKRGATTDHRSDLYSLAIVFHEMLTGRHPLSSASVSDRCGEETLAVSGSLHHIDPTIPVPLARIIRRMLEKDPKARYPHANQMVQELEAYVTQSTSSVSGLENETKPTNAIPSKRSPYRKALHFMLTGLIVILLSSLFSFFTRWYSQAMPPAEGRNESFYRDVVQQIERLGHSRPADQIRLWTNQKTYRQGEKIIYTWQSQADCFVNLFCQTTEGGLIQLFPNKYHPNTQIYAHRIYRIPSGEADIRLEVDGPPGTEVVILLVGEQPFEIVPSNYSDDAFPEVNRDARALLSRIEKNVVFCKNRHLKQKRIEYRIVDLERTSR